MKRQNRYVDDVVVLPASAVTQGPTERARLEKAKKDQAERLAGWTPLNKPIGDRGMVFDPRPRTDVCGAIEREELPV